ncbi:efflux RND transporter periplasmic adaptor subunit [Actinomycetaceae bacterium L2_0104]
MSVLRLLVWTIIAVALVKVAFFPSTEANENDGLEPGGQYGQLTVLPEVASITNSLALDGTVQSDPSSSIKATFEGQVTEFYVNDGATVNEGDTLLILEREEPGPDVVTQDEEGNEVVTPGETVWKHKYITAPASGTVSFTAILNQQFVIGDSLGTVQPPTFSAVSALTPDQMYRIQDVPSKATITIKNGPAPFECEGLEIVTPQDAQPTSPESSEGGEPTATIQARCAIPDGQKVFAGLQVTMDIVAGEATDVLTLPASAVEGRYQKGFVYAPTEDPDKPKKIEVELGLTDGMRVQITGGIEPEQELLEFIPGNSEMECNPFTGEGC